MVTRTKVVFVIREYFESKQFNRTLFDNNIFNIIPFLQTQHAPESSLLIGRSVDVTTASVSKYVQD